MELANGTDKKGGSFDIKSLYTRKPGKKKTKSSKRGKNKSARGSAKEPATAAANGLNGLLDSPHKPTAPPVPVNPIMANGKLSPLRVVPVDGKGAYLVLPPEDRAAAAASEAETPAKTKVPFTDPIVLYSSAGRVAASIESLPLVLGTITGMAMGAISGFLWASKK